MALSSNVKALAVRETTLRRFVKELLMAVGVPDRDADITAHVLVDADLTGRDTHGVSRLPLYVDRIRKGVINPRPVMTVEYPRYPTAGTLQGDNGLGPVVAWRAMEEAIAVSGRYGTGSIAVRLSNHAGAMSVYCEEAARRGHILVALTNSPPGIPPWGGRTPFLGTNPIAAGFPRGADKPPLVIDLATSVVARGNIIQAARLHQPIPEGWAIDADGFPTTDAEKALAGAVLPMAGAKGYALALMVEIFSGVLSAAGVGPGVKNPYNDFSGPANVGHFFWAMEPDGFPDGFAERLASLEDGIRAVSPMPGQTVRLPGDRAEARRRQSRVHGIWLDRGLFDQLNTLAGVCGVSGMVPEAPE